MSAPSITAFLAALICGGLALALLLSRRRSIAGWFFTVGIVLLGLEQVLVGFSLRERAPVSVVHWESLALIVRSFSPAVWLGFSLTYSRGDALSYFKRWRWILLGTFLIPVALALGSAGQLVREVSYREEDGGGWWVGFTPVVRMLSLLDLAASIAILANIEKTFRSAIGTMQWRIKFVALGIGAIFGARIYAGSQIFLFSAGELNLAVVQSAALIMGSVLIAIAYARHGFAEIDIYPSGAVLRNSVALALAGGYLVIVGALAQWAPLVGGMGSLHLQSLVVMAGAIVLAILLLSDRLKQRLRRFISQHFRRPMHDSRAIWTLFTQRLSQIFDAREYGARTVQLLSETFSALSVTLWLFDEQMNQLTLSASTSTVRSNGNGAHENPHTACEVSKQLITQLQAIPGPFELDGINEPWIQDLRKVSPNQFRTGGKRICIPLFAKDRGLGLIILADRVNGMPYLIEELDLLKCIGEHVTAGLHQMLLTEELMRGRELAAFQAMSTFFVHDLKNAASSLSLMLENLPEHFHDPEFRQDALRAIAGAINRINQIIGKLSGLRQKLELRSEKMDLNHLVHDALGRMGGFGKIALAQKLQPLPHIVGDRSQLENVLINLLANAREAVGVSGRVSIETARRDDWVILSVVDDGCGMSPTFIRDSLFRPFQTTKNKGLGIGMFQSKLIVEAHQGTMKVESEPGRGTTFQVILPLAAQPS